MLRFFAVFLLVPSFLSGQTAYSGAMYWRALAETSTSPLYVLVTIANKPGNGELVCIPAPFLLGAIHREFRLDYDKAGEGSALGIAEVQVGRSFLFSRQEALANVQPRYTREILAEVRTLLGGLSYGELLEQAKARPKIDKTHMDADSINRAIRRAQRCPLQEIYRSKTAPLAFAAYRDAVAHVLLEHGILVGISDIPGDLYVQEMEPNRLPGPTSPLVTADH